MDNAKVAEILRELWRYKDTDKYTEEEIREALEKAASAFSGEGVKPMSEVERLEEYLKRTSKEGATKDEWMMGLFMRIAHSLAVIADKIGEGEKNGSMDSDN